MFYIEPDVFFLLHFQVLSTENCRVKAINIKDNELNESSKDDKMMFEKYLQQLPVNSVLLDEIIMYDCKLTDDIFIPIASILKFVKKIRLDSNELNSKSLYKIIEVGLYLYQSTTINVNKLGVQLIVK